MPETKLMNVRVSYDVTNATEDDKPITVFGPANSPGVAVYFECCHYSSKDTFLKHISQIASLQGFEFMKVRELCLYDIDLNGNCNWNLFASFILKCKNLTSMYLSECSLTDSDFLKKLPGHKGEFLATHFGNALSTHPNLKSITIEDQEAKYTELFKVDTKEHMKKYVRSILKSDITLSSNNDSHTQEFNQIRDSLNSDTPNHSQSASLNGRYTTFAVTGSAVGDKRPREGDDRNTKRQRK